MRAALLAAVSGRSQQNPSAPLRQYIFVTDCSGDVGDLPPLKMMAQAHKEGAIELLAVIVSSSYDYAAPCVKACLEYMGLSSIPVGAFQTGSFAATTPALATDWPKSLAEAFGHTGDVRSNYTAALTIYRTALAGARDGNVVVVDVGPMNASSQLLDSSADGISGLTGAELISQKVSRFHFMGGYETTGTEYNFNADPAGAANVMTNWPTAKYGIGFTAGNTVWEGPHFGEDPLTNPFKKGFDLYASYLVANKRQAWDSLAAYWALHFDTPHLSAGSAGTNSFVGGTNTFTAGAGNTYYATKVATDAWLSAILDDQLDKRGDQSTNTAYATYARPGAYLLLNFREGWYRLNGTVYSTLPALVSAAGGTGPSSPTISDGAFTISGSSDIVDIPFSVISGAEFGMHTYVKQLTRVAAAAQGIAILKNGSTNVAGHQMSTSDTFQGYTLTATLTRNGPTKASPWKDIRGANAWTSAAGLRGSSEGATANSTGTQDARRTITKLVLGYDGTNSYLGGGLSCVEIYTTKPTDAQLQELAK